MKAFLKCSSPTTRHTLALSRFLSISKSPPPTLPPRTFIPQRARPEPFVNSPPKLFVDQPSDLSSTREPPVRIHRLWTKNPPRNRFLKRYGYLTKEATEQFGPPQFVLPGDQNKSELPVLDISVWHNAIVLVDKPKRWTSFDVCAKIRNALFRYPFKVGHCGTLDPLATGLLIVCLGSATKTSQKLVRLDKEYTGTMKLGMTTPSYDASEPVTSRLPWEHITDEQIDKVAAFFRGSIKQQPPMYSAVKKDGTRLYEYAHEGKTVDRKARHKIVKEFSLERTEPNSPVFQYKIRCSSGTYVRSLVHDLGQRLGCGAYVRSLRRESVGPYTLADAWKLEELLEVIKASKVASR